MPTTSRLVFCNEIKFNFLIIKKVERNTIRKRILVQIISEKLSTSTPLYESLPDQSSDTIFSHHLPILLQENMKHNFSTKHNFWKKKHRKSANNTRSSVSEEPYESYHRNYSIPLGPTTILS